MSDLVLDPAIRTWVFVPIVFITFIVGILRHYASLLWTTKKRLDLQQIQDNHYLTRARLLRENGRLLPRKSFHMRKTFLCDEEHGYLAQSRERPSTAATMMDPEHFADMMKDKLLNMIPMIAIGSWINWTFSGFLTTRLPFPLTLRFKPMLQRGIELGSLDAAWVSSASWYFLNVFGLRSIYTLVLGEDNAADTSKMMEDQMSGMAAPLDPKMAFKAEWEALQIYQHFFSVEPRRIPR